MKQTPTVIIDSREQTPWCFDLPTTTATLATGDYSIAGLTRLVSIERKSLPDFVQCCGTGRERFVRELQRLAGVRYRAVFLEADLTMLEAGGWLGRLTPNHILGSVASWSGKYSIPFFLAGDAAAAGRLAERFLIQSARHVCETYEHAAAFLRAAG